MTHRKTVLSILLLIIIPCIFFYRTIFFGKLPVPTDSLVGMYHPYRDMYVSDYPRGIPFKNYLITDPIRQQIPWKKLVIDSWKQGKWPLWNPYEFSGASLSGNIQAAPFYPLNILFFLYSFEYAWTIYIIFQPVLASVFMFYYLRNLSLSHCSSVIGGIIYAYSGFMTAWMTWGTIGHVILWAPLILLSIDKLFFFITVNLSQNVKPQISSVKSIIQNDIISKKNLIYNVIIWCIVGIISITSSFFAGHSQIFLYIFIVSLCYGIFRLSFLKANNDKLKAFALFTLCGTIILFITSIQWKPLLSNLQSSSRIIELVNWQKEGWFLPFEHLIQFIAPDFFGNPATLNYWGKWNYGEFIGYIGIIPLFFTTITLLTVTLYQKFPYQKNTILFFIFTGIITMLFLLPTPVAILPYIFHFPLVSTLQPTRLLSIITLIFSILAAFGFEIILKTPKKTTSVVLLLYIILVVLLWIFVQYSYILPFDITRESINVSKRNLIIPTILILITSLLFTGKYFIQSVRYTILFNRILYCLLLIIILFDLTRVFWKFMPFTDSKYFFPQTNIITYLQNQQKPFRTMSLQDEIFPPNILSYYGIESVDGYDPVIPFEYEEFIASNERGEPNINLPFGFNRIVRIKNIDAPLWKLFNVKYVVSLTDVIRPELREVAREGDTRLYEYIHALPRVYFAEKVINANSTQDVYDKLYEFLKYNYRLAVTSHDTILSNNPNESDEISDITVFDDILSFQSRTSGSRFVVISMRYNQSMCITIDGRIVRPIRTNAIFTGIPVEAGDHSVIIKYQ